MPAPWAMPVCFTLLQTQEAQLVGSVAGRKEVEESVRGRLRVLALWGRAWGGSCSPSPNCSLSSPTF